MEISYAQRLEDYYLSLAFAGEKPGFYVDIGAGHPIEDNVSYWFYLQGWRGLVVEPQRALLKAYGAVRDRDLLDDSLIGAAPGRAAFHVFPTLHGLSTMKLAHAEAARTYEASFRTEERDVATLAQLLDRHGVTTIDFLKIDVEGSEADVFAGADWVRWRPRVILAEVVSPGAAADARSPWEDALVARNYAFALFDGLNKYYVAKEERGLLERFPREIAPWDVVGHNEFELSSALADPDEASPGAKPAND